MAAGASVVIDRASAWLAAQLGDSHAVEHGVDTAVAGSVEGGDGGAGRVLLPRTPQGGRAVEPGEAVLAGEAPAVTDVDEELGVGAVRDATQLAQRRAGSRGEPGDHVCGFVLAGVEVDELLEVAVQEPEAKLRDAIERDAAVAAGDGGEARADAADIESWTRISRVARPAALRPRW